ncbi:uncharacterized protein LOC129302697 [Prosopis cineraria]|uniref:uncharacterized protein LOC129302697 n=1 Tax=Prosopis cineraria TaxID=364024 RepID=UPI0024101D40|nr:uncharacterized protein LOC129302697 [Prosopis cineraria]
MKEDMGYESKKLMSDEFNESDGDSMKVDVNPIDLGAIPFNIHSNPLSTDDNKDDMADSDASGEWVGETKNRRGKQERRGAEEKKEKKLRGAQHSWTEKQKENRALIQKLKKETDYEWKERICEAGKEKWKNCLKPGIKKGALTKEEQRLVIR